MRTTVNIDADLLREARARAVSTRLSLGDVVNDALRLLLRGGQTTDQPVDLPVFGGSGLRPGVDLEDKDSLASILDGDRDARAAG